MGRRYTFDDLNIATPPRISKGVWQFGLRVYHWRCLGRTATGYGTTPIEAYAKWEMNWKRRLKRYGSQHERATQWLRAHGQGSTD